MVFLAAKHQQKLRLLERTDNSEQLSKKQQTTPAPDSTTSPTPPTHTQAAPNQPDQVTFIALHFCMPLFSRHIQGCL